MNSNHTVHTPKPPRRDLKPQNIMLTRKGSDGLLKIVDLGVSAELARVFTNVQVPGGRGPETEGVLSAAGPRLSHWVMLVLHAASLTTAAVSRGVLGRALQTTVPNIPKRRPGGGAGAVCPAAQPLISSRSHPPAPCLP